MIMLLFLILCVFFCLCYILFINWSYVLYLFDHFLYLLYYVCKHVENYYTIFNFLPNIFCNVKFYILLLLFLFILVFFIYISYKFNLYNKFPTNLTTLCDTFLFKFNIFIILKDKFISLKNFIHAKSNINNSFIVFIHFIVVIFFIFMLYSLLFNFFSNFIYTSLIDNFIFDCDNKLFKVVCLLSYSFFSSFSGFVLIVLFIYRFFFLFNIKLDNFLSSILHILFISGWVFRPFLSLIISFIFYFIFVTFINNFSYLISAPFLYSFILCITHDFSFNSFIDFILCYYNDYNSYYRVSTFTYVLKFIHSFSDLFSLYFYFSNINFFLYLYTFILLFSGFFQFNINIFNCSFINYRNFLRNFNFYSCNYLNGLFIKYPFIDYIFRFSFIRWLFLLDSNRFILVIFYLSIIYSLFITLYTSPFFYNNSLLLFNNYVIFTLFYFFLTIYPIYIYFKYIDYIKPLWLDYLKVEYNFTFKGRVTFWKIFYILNSYNHSKTSLFTIVSCFLYLFLLLLIVLLYKFSLGHILHYNIFTDSCSNSLTYFSPINSLFYTHSYFFKYLSNLFTVIIPSLYSIFINDPLICMRYSYLSFIFYFFYFSLVIFSHFILYLLFLLFIYKYYKFNCNFYSFYKRYTNITLLILYIILLFIIYSLCFLFLFY